VRQLDVAELTSAVSRLCIEANTTVRPDVLRALRAAAQAEESEIGRDVVDQILANAEIAAAESIPMCQDTGYVTVFLELGRDVHLVGGVLREAIDEGIRRGYTEGSMRASMVTDVCFERSNTGDNTPGLLHTEIVSGERVRVTVMPKGAGSDNAGALAMLKVSEGLRVAEEFAVCSVEAGAPDACPPVVVGIGIGSSFDGVALLAKKALLRPIGRPNGDARLAEAERRILSKINASGIGPGGTGGRVTALGVSIETAPCHMASFPIAVNISCHVLRSATAEL